MANVGSLTRSPLQQALLTAPEGAIVRRLCSDLKHPVAVKTPDPMYPPVCPRETADGCNRRLYDSIG
jgi:hypothetical protein